MKRDLINIVSEVQGVENSVDVHSRGLTNYLSKLDLPTENVLVSPDERMVVINNVPSIVIKIDSEIRKQSMYISKFIAACGAGLFDAALNFLWNETVMNLREKVIRFDLSYFLQSVVKDEKKKNSIKTFEDLKKIDDWELIKGCKDTGIISEIAFKHLDFIRDMRNHASAAHPNHTELDGLQLSSWLQTCIKEVLAKEPEEPMIETTRLLNNIRMNTFSREDIKPIERCLHKLPDNLLISLFRTTLGMYIDDKLQIEIRNNLKLILPSIWELISEEEKNEAGLKYSWLSVNGDLIRKNLAYELLEICDGLSYLPEDHLIIEMDQCIDALFSAHIGWDNFYNEPPHARNLSKFIPSNGKIPKQLEMKYVKTIVMAKIGNGYGVSSIAEEYYDYMISMFDERKILRFIQLLKDSDVQSRLQFSRCAERYKKLVKILKIKTTDQNIINTLEMIGNTSNNVLPKLVNDVVFKRTANNIKSRKYLE